MADQPSQFACEPERECLAADVAKVQPDSKLKNTLILRRRLRIRLLDCRSGEALVGQPVEQVRLNGEPLAKFLAEDRHWDISEHFPISGSGANRKFGKTAVSLTKASQIVLNALGYECGTPSNSYGPQGKTAFLKFRVVARAVVFKPEDFAKLGLFDRTVLLAKFQPASGKKALRGVKDAADKEVEFRAPTDAEVDELIRIYNTKCYRAAQFHLASLDFYPRDDAELKDGVLDAPDSGNWTDGWKKAFKDWQKVTYGRKEENCWDWIKRKEEGKDLMEQKRGFVTDENGDFFVPIPVSLLTQNFTVEVGFKEFAILAEATLKEYEGNGEKVHRAVMPAAKKANAPSPPPLPVSGPTQFSVEWVPPDGGQKNEWDKPWGWRCGIGRSTSDTQRSAFKEFRTSGKFEIPAFTQAELDDPKKGPNWSVLHGRTKALSMFYDSAETTPEFVLFALVWCQPVWDEFKDPPARGNSASVTSDAYIWPNTDGLGTQYEPADPRLRDSGNHMHIVTYYSELSGSENFGGKGYGIYEHDKNAAGQTIATRWRGPATDTDPYGGHHGFDLNVLQGDYHFAVHGGQATYKDSGNSGLGRSVSIVGSQRNADGEISTVSVGGGHLREKIGTFPRFVRAGEIVGLGGRTGNIGSNSPWPTHVHLNVGHLNQLYTTADEANRCCVPTNYRTSLLLPCRCETTGANAADISQCKFGKTTIVSVCWAVNDLICPHMPRGNATLNDLAASGANSSKRQVQAQLRKLGFDPGTLDGDLGVYPKEATVKTANANLRETAPEGKVLGQAAKDTKLAVLDLQGEWFQVTLPADVQTASGKTSGWVKSTLVNADSIGKTRAAIRAFKEKYALTPAHPTMKDLYEMDDASLSKLNEVAPLVPVE